MRVAVLISGGVDSSVALRLLKDQGHELTAFYIKIWMEDRFSHLGNCPWEEDLRYVEEICDELKVPLEIVSLQKEYWNGVVKEAIKEVKAGRTPNPDVWCNQRVKFGVFYDYIGDKFDKIATGHYAQIEDVSKSGVKLLKRPPDAVKDQTYFLAILNQKQLAKAMFPIGHLTKKGVRELAKKFNLPNKDRKDSQGICFLGKIKYRDFLKEHLGFKKGDIINKKTGEKMGEHNGYWYYTIGQRQGIKLSGGPWYVVEKDIKKNIVYIADSDELVLRARDNFLVGDLHWISGRVPKKKQLEVKIRHGKKSYKCKVEYRSDKSDRSDRVDRFDNLVVSLNKADSGIAAGQYAVFYDGDICLGGGVIE